MSKLSICIPVYNEENTVRELLDKVLAVSLEKELIVVDDASTDGTALALAAYSRLPEVKIVTLATNGGKGTALREAFRYVTGDFVVIQDADLEYDPNDFVRMLQTAESSGAQAVYGSRFLAGFSLAAVKNLFASSLLSLFVLVLYGQYISDESTCYKLFKADLLKSITLACKRFEFCPEVTAKILKKGVNIIEVPVTFTPRAAKDGKKIHYLRDGLEAVKTLIKYRFIN